MYISLYEEREGYRRWARGIEPVRARALRKVLSKYETYVHRTLPPAPLAPVNFVIINVAQDFLITPLLHIRTTNTYYRRA